jgi:hypothetical protein
MEIAMRSAVFAKTMSLCAVVILGASATARAETSVTFTSRYDKTIKVCVYNTGDLVQGVPLKAWEIDPNKSVEWKGGPSKFLVKVFKPQFLDQALASKNQVAYNTTVTLKNASIDVANKPRMTLKNSSGRKLKFCLYNAGDNVMAIPLKTWTLDNSKTATWIDAPAKYNLKIFEPAVFDKLVATKTGVPDRRTVSATHNSGKYQLQVN